MKNILFASLLFTGLLALAPTAQADHYRSYGRGDRCGDGYGSSRYSGYGRSYSRYDCQPDFYPRYRCDQRPSRYYCPPTYYGYSVPRPVYRSRGWDDCSPYRRSSGSRFSVFFGF
jgi:hypothetical protein